MFRKDVVELEINSIKFLKIIFSFEINTEKNRKPPSPHLYRLDGDTHRITLAVKNVVM